MGWTHFWNQSHAGRGETLLLASFSNTADFAILEVLQNRVTHTSYGLKNAQGFWQLEEKPEHLYEDKNELQHLPKICHFNLIHPGQFP